MNICSCSSVFYKIYLVKKDIKILINQNRSVFISFNPETNKLSLHKVFLHASKEIIDAICNFITKNRVQTAKEMLVNYINSQQENIQKEPKFKDKKEGKGLFYNLNEIYDKLNKEYFNDELNLDICWFGRNKVSKVSSRTLGVFHHDCELIRIHKCLDHKEIPRFFIEYVVYHEMLHYFFPVIINSQGRRIMHSISFKKKERDFAEYSRARLWEKENKRFLFR